MNEQHEDRQPPETLREEIGRLEIRKLRAETRLLEAGMRRDRFRLALDIVKWSVIGAAVVLATVAANHIGLI